MTHYSPTIVTMVNKEIAPEKCDTGNDDVETGKNENCWSSGVWRMVLAAVIANMPYVSAGLSMGFSAILIPQLQLPDSDIPITLEEGSWIASLFIIGDLLGCTIGGPLAERFGRRIAILLDCLPLTVGWILTLDASTLENLYIARIISGVGQGMLVTIISMYSREISTPSMRGSLAILMIVALNTGNLFMYILGYFMSWRLSCIPGSVIPLIPFLMFAFLPESPVWLAKRKHKIA